MRFLAGYRRGWPFEAALLDRLRHTDLKSTALHEAARGLSEYPIPQVRAALLHLL